MQTVHENAFLFTTTYFKLDGDDYEPDEEWKLELRKKIQEGIHSMIADALENHADELRKAMQTIQNLAMEQYESELEREHNQRRWAAGVPISTFWTQHFHNEHQNILNSIEQSPSLSSSGSMDSVDRSFARSPLKPPSEAWKSAISPAEGTLPAKTLNLGRHGSDASMRSTGSGARIHSSVTEIMEKIYPSINDIPIPRRTLSLNELTVLLARKYWAAEGNCHPNNDYHEKVRLSPNVESLSDDDESSFEDETEAKRQDLEARRQKLEKVRRGVDDRLKRIELKIQWEEARKKREDEKRNEVEYKEEEARKREEAIRMEEELRKKEAKLKKKEEEAAKKEAAAKRIEEAKRKEQDARKKVEAAKREEDEARRKAEELSKEEETRQRTAQVQEAAKNFENIEEARTKDMEVKERPDILHWRNEGLMRRELVRFRREEAAKEKEEGRKREELKEAARKEAVRQEETRKRQEAQQKQMEEKAKAAKRREDARREEARLERFRREQEEKRLQNESRAEFHKSQENIRQPKPNYDSAWLSPSYLSGPPRMSSGMSRTPQPTSPLIPERSAGPSGWGTGLASAWGASIKLTASSPTTSLPTGIQRTGSASSGTPPTSSLRHTASFSEAERTRKQQEFAESQQEQFRRAQEKLQAARRNG